ncbi:MAG: 4-hydroxythreonine-4-phosphate dehydrogenase PdxA [Planctomycetota bacterium]|nr:4-hydroxythreonine-4-phosphate dehydrogenase PdxA [Planctomycetota bacterium]
MSADRRPRVVISMGDPGGIGPEVVVKALCDAGLRARARVRVLGPAWAMSAAARRGGLKEFWSVVPAGVRGADADDGVVVVDSGEVGPFEAKATARGGAISFRAVEEAIRLARLPADDDDRADAIVTAPISKEAWALAGHREFPGHTERLAARFGRGGAGESAPGVAMMFHAPGVREGAPTLNVVLVTAHVPLARVRESITMGRVLEVIRLGAEAMQRLGVREPRLAVCGLNPHAGEAGLLGDDEERVIGPAVEAACELGLDVRGPFPGDTIFGQALKGRFDLVVAMYHDQGLIPVKLLAFDRAVNVTIGLKGIGGAPAVRTSPDHGTAYDIAGADRADPGSMHAALALAIRMASRG